MTDIERINAIGLWYENGGLYNIQLDYIYTIFKIVVIYILMSIPFTVHFRGQSDNLDLDMEFYVVYLPLYIYLSITHFIVGFVFTTKYYENIKTVKAQKHYYIENGLDIDDTRGATLNSILTTINMDSDKFLAEYLKTANIMVACHEQHVFDNRYCKNLLWTMPFELIISSLLENFYKKRTLSQISNNVDALRQLCRRAGFVILPFIPSLLIYGFCNHILSNNSEVFSRYSYSRLGRWQIRLFNVFDNDLKMQCDTTIKMAEDVVSTYNYRKWKNTMYRICSFICATFGFLCLYCTLYGYEKFLNIDIYTLIGIFTAISAFTYPKSIILHGNELTTINNTLKTQYTAYDLSLVVSNKAFILLQELFSILLLPILFWFWIPDNAFLICNFYSCYVTAEGYTVYSLRNNCNMSSKSSKSFTNL